MLYHCQRAVSTLYANVANTSQSRTHTPQYASTLSTTFVRGKLRTRICHQHARREASGNSTQLTFLNLLTRQQTATMITVSDDPWQDQYRKIARPTFWARYLLSLISQTAKNKRSQIEACSPLGFGSVKLRRIVGLQQKIDLWYMHVNTRRRSAAVILK